MYTLVRGEEHGKSRVVKFFGFFRPVAADSCWLVHLGPAKAARWLCSCDLALIYGHTRCGCYSESEPFFVIGWEILLTGSTPGESQSNHSHFQLALAVCNNTNEWQNHVHHNCWIRSRISPTVLALSRLLRCVNVTHGEYNHTVYEYGVHWTCKWLFLFYNACQNYYTYRNSLWLLNFVNIGFVKIIWKAHGCQQPYRG